MANIIALRTLSQSFLFGGLIVKSSLFRWTLFTLIFAVNAYLYRSPEADISTKTSLLTSVFYASDYLLVTNVQNELFLTSQTRPISEQAVYERLKWALQLLSGVRGIGWKHEPPIPIIAPRPPKTLSRLSFILHQLKWIAIYYILHDMTVTFIIKPMPTLSMANIPPFATIPLLQRCLGVIGFAAGMYTVLSVLYGMYSVIMVGFGLSEPSEWPHLFGSWRQAHTVRKFWGRTWHQLLRRCLSAHGKFFAHKVFKFNPGTNLSSYTQLYIAFALSGVIHSYTLSPTLSDFDSRPLVFFVMQALAITFEDGVIAMFEKTSRSELEVFGRLVGYFWTFGWFVYSMPPWLDSQAADGCIVQTRLPFSLISWILGLRA